MVLEVHGAGRWVGTVAHVGADHLTLLTDHGPAALVPLDAVGWVGPTPGSPAGGGAAGDRPGGRGSLAEALADLAACRAGVRIHLRHGEARTGALVAASDEVLSLVPPGDGVPAVHAPLAAVAAVAVLDAR